MESLKELYDLIPDSFAAQTMSRLQEIYHDIETHTQSFRQEHGISCPEGCGACCERFVPDITPVEARLVAAYLLFVQNRTDVLQLMNDHAMGLHFPISSVGGTANDPQMRGCPLYNPDSPYHCSVYEVRPLICRLFGAATSDTKDGGSAFRRCKVNPANTMPTYLSFSADDPVPVMGEYAMQVRSVDEANVEVQLLPEAVAEAFPQLQFLMYLYGLDSPPDSNPDNTPNPLAS